MFKILQREQLTENIVLLKVKAPNVAKKCQPGQFVIVVEDEKDERLPFTICDFDREEETITLVIQIVGDGSKNFVKSKQENILEI